MAVKERVTGGAPGAWWRCNLTTWHCHRRPPAKHAWIRSIGLTPLVPTGSTSSEHVHKLFLHVSARFRHAPGALPGGHVILGPATFAAFVRAIRGSVTRPAHCPRSPKDPEDRPKL